MQSLSLLRDYSKNRSVTLININKENFGSVTIRILESFDFIRENAYNSIKPLSITNPCALLSSQKLVWSLVNNSFDILLDKAKRLQYHNSYWTKLLLIWINVIEMSDYDYDMVFLASSSRISNNRCNRVFGYSRITLMGLFSLHY